MGRLLLKHLWLTAAVVVGIVLMTNLGLAFAEGTRAKRPVPDTLGRAGEATVKLLLDFARGDLGPTTISSVTGNRESPLRDVVATTYPRSLGLIALGVGLGALLGLPLGALSAVRRHTRLSAATWALSIVGISAPSFMLAVLLQLLAVEFYARTGTRLVPVQGFGWDSHLVMPMLVLAARPLAYTAEVTSTALGAALEQDFIRTATAKGLPGLWILGGHALRNALVPILTGIAVSLRFSLGSLPVVELFFNWQGLGQFMLVAVQRGETTATAVLALCLGLTFLAVNCCLEIAYRAIDPRLLGSGTHSGCGPRSSE